MKSNIVHKGVQTPHKSRLEHTNIHSSKGEILGKDFQKHDDWHVFSKGLMLKYSAQQVKQSTWDPVAPNEQDIKDHFLPQHKSGMELQYHMLAKDWPEFLNFPGQVDVSHLQH